MHWSHLDHKVTGQRGTGRVRDLPAEQESQALALCSYWRDVALFGVSVSLHCLRSPEREQRGPWTSKALASLEPPFRSCTNGKDAGCSGLLHPSHGSLCQKTGGFCLQGGEQAEQERRNTHLYKFLVLKKKNLRLVLELKRSKSGFFLPCTPAQVQTDREQG